jgi:hypothetical protein
LAPPGQGGNQRAVEQRQRGEGDHRDQARAYQVEVAISAAQGLKARADDDQQQVAGC